jgi:maltose phosphorylase
MDKEQKVASDLKPSERPINQHWSWDRILRSIYIKQADVLQGIYFFWDQFSREEIESNYDFYEPKTLHESSLSPCVHAVIAARLNRAQEAYDHYLRTARLDLDDYNAEVHEGLHITSMAGTWLSVIEGFGGFRVVDGMPCFDGVLPREWGELRYRIQFRGRDLEVSTTQKLTKVVLKSGDSLDVMVNGKSQLLEGIKDS